MTVIRRFSPIVVIVLLAGCSSTPDNSSQNATDLSSQGVTAKRYDFIPLSVPLEGRSNLDNFYRYWRGAPYRLGGTTRAGIDCSAFVQKGVLELFKHDLPRTTEDQSKQGQWVAIDKLKHGDLVFFKTGRSLRHVGIYLGDAQFLHASTSQGVIISSLKNPYWRSVYWQARRL
ncbi:hypothetical protein ABT56_07545 [Photobacterium aquae]|uniref:NlpC/P60 domain-containing protein n=1 Tax=Photobacterium aquae TaxID=1195763 RepID=A0A0J1JXH2_9GAMM|nr:NlpC/P60 family protein [Photobacterium aquae]KLV06992.1 hypothetical protein ABT56_07545 [Photobacterium aquae]